MCTLRLLFVLNRAYLPGKAPCTTTNVTPACVSATFFFFRFHWCLFLNGGCSVAQEHVSGSNRHRETVLRGGTLRILDREILIFGGWIGEWVDVVMYAAEMQEFAVGGRGVARQGVGGCVLRLKSGEEINSGGWCGNAWWLRQGPS